MASFEVSSKPCTGASPSVRLCVGLIKALKPLLCEIRGFIYTNNQKAVFSVIEKSFSGYLLSVGRIFVRSAAILVLISKRREGQKKDKHFSFALYIRLREKWADKKTAPGGCGRAKNPVRDVAALVVLEERGGVGRLGLFL